jgi:flagellar hook protein FlgE
MSLTTSLYTSLTGLDASSTMISVAGNNISNVNTTGYKSSRVTFETSIVQNMSPATAPTAGTGGTNPTQVGLGVKTGTVTRDFSAGSLQPTGLNTDLAIEGNGFFIVDSADSTNYTRNGNFKLDRDYNIVSGDGRYLQGYGVDEDFEIVEGVLQNVNIPLGITTLAEATSEVKMSGNLNAAGDVATTGSVTNSQALTAISTGLPITAGTALTDVSTDGVTPLFAGGDLVSFYEVTKGGATLPEKVFEVAAAITDPTTTDDAGTTVQDYLDFLEDVAGVDTTVSGGAAVNATGEIVLTSNLGTANAIDLDGANIVVNRATSPTQPFTFTETTEADGESVRTSFAAYDSLGNPLSVDVTFVLEARDGSGSTWRFYAQSEEDTDLDRSLGTGTLTFDTEGRLLNVQDADITVDRVDTGAQTPQSIELSFINPSGTVSSLVDQGSQIATLSQDGSPIGTLVDFTVQADGSIVGSFSNSLLRTLGQIPVANFSNPQGLVEVGGSLFDVTTNSGSAQIVVPGTAGTGGIVGGALEQSNVELANEFINLISASTGFSASSRVLSTSDQLIQELLATVR